MLAALLALALSGGGASASDAGVVDASVDSGTAADAETADAVLDAGEPLEGDPADAEASPPALWVPPPLPPAELSPHVAPVLDGERAEAAPIPPLAPGERPAFLVKTILGILALFVLAYLGGHPRVQEWERTLRISQLITAGLPFILLGLVARHPSVGVLTDPVLSELGPVLRLGLGWIGFVVGFRVDARLLAQLPVGVAAAVGIATAIPFATVAGASGLLLLLSEGGPKGSALADPVFLRDALVLGTAGAMTSWVGARVAASGEKTEPLERMIRLEEIAGVLGLAIVAAYFRPRGVAGAWQLPGTAWIFLTVGIGVTVGAVVYAILHQMTEGPEFVVLTLGSISLTAGIAGYLQLSPLVVCFVSGVLLANFPGAYKDKLGETLRKLERPIYLLSLVVIGALWRIGEPVGWVLMIVFAGARFLGKWVGAEVAHRRGPIELGPAERRVLAIAPLGELSVAIVVSALLLYPGGSMSYIVSAVVGGALLSELLLQLAGRREGNGRTPPAAASRPEDAA